MRFTFTPPPPLNQPLLPLFAQRESKLEQASKPSSDTSRKSPRTTKGASDDDRGSNSEGSNSDSDSDSSEADGGLVLVQKKKRSEGGEGDGDGMGPEEDAAFADLLQKGKKKEKKMKITSDGVAAAGVATKKVFDDDGAAEVRVLPVACLLAGWHRTLYFWLDCPIYV